jgi:hypothetical protein
MLPRTFLRLIPVVLAVIVMMLLHTNAKAQTQTPTPTTTNPPVKVVVPIVFPLGGKCNYTDSFGAPRDGGKRGHEGCDIMAAKMTHILAVVDGTVDWLNDGTQTSTANGLPYYNLMLHGDDGNDYYYIHINNDTPGTDDGLGGPACAYAPDITDGCRVVAGQHIAYVGDSGNAEDTAPHLHFEIHLGGYKNPVNPYPSLVAAQRGSLFTDVKPGDWPFQYINTLAKEGIVNGYGNGKFKPDALVTRAEFIKMVVTATKVEASTTFEGLFPDVPKTHWSWLYVEAARRTGIIAGNVNGRFRPDMPINRAEAAKIVTSARHIASSFKEPVFSDVAKDFWACESIMAAYSNGTLSGYPNGTFKPLNPTNRAESSKIIYKISQP